MEPWLNCGSAAIEAMGEVTFARPPLVEVSFAVVFQRLPALGTAHFGLFWHGRKEEFPETTDKPPLAPAGAAQLAPAAAGLASGVLGLLGMPWFPTPRVWFVHRDKQLLMQLQADRLLFNWRRLTPDMVYPRFENLLPMFMSQVKAFAQFVEDQGLGQLCPVISELTYVNHVVADDNWSGLNALGDVFVDVDWKPAAHRPPKPIGVAWQAAWSSGTLNVRANVKTAQVPPEGKEFAVVELKTGASVTTLLNLETWFQSANEAAVTAFLEMTTPWAQHELWQRQS